MSVAAKMLRNFLLMLCISFKASGKAMQNFFSFFSCIWGILLFVLFTIAGWNLFTQQMFKINITMLITSTPRGSLSTVK